MAFLLIPPLVRADRGKVGLEEYERSVYQQTGFNKQSFDDISLDDTINGLMIRTVGCFTNVCPKEESEGAIHQAGKMIAALYIPPASGIVYLADIIENFTLTKPVYARNQGLGFQALQPLLPLWKASRNLAYLLFTLVFVALGFAVMFRVKISPQATMTIQAAVPRILIALILVTFSYAIVGFIIDLTYILFFVIVGAFEQFKGIEPHEATRIRSDFLTAGFFDTIKFVFGKGIGAVGDIIRSVGP